MNDLHPSAQEAIDRERDAWRGADAIPADGPARAWAAGPVRARAVLRARVVRGLLVAVAIALFVWGLTQLARRRETTPHDQPTRSTSSTSTDLRRLEAPPSSSAPAPSVVAPAIDPASPSIPAADPVETRIDAPLSARRPDIGELRNTPAVSRRDAGSNVVSVAAPEDSLGAEFRLLREARVAVRDGQLEHALALCAQHGERFPDGVLTPERRSIERRARCMIAEREGHPMPEGCR